ncbi:MAG: sigma-54-dependent Fis family transcriptional regulator [Fibrobacteria bacterium]|nr:sigma-54-dependent Fis family transcriptional regulator [Fibrobacteria bacterium]
MKHKILLVDDEKSILDALSRALSGVDCKILTALDGLNALQVIRKTSPEIVITDLRMPKMNGIQLLEKIKEINDSIQIIVITGHGTIEDAVNAMKKGAYDFITKPFKKQQIVAVVQRAMEKALLLQENINLKQKLKKSRKNDFEWVKSREFKELLERSAQAAKSDATILILGGAGTGKGVLANYIYDNSTRSEEALIKINCATIPDDLLEAELFGYKEGAFSGAVQDRIGKFQEAHKGTIFLDEIAEIPPAIQSKLLSVLQDGEINPIGGRAEKVDVRIVAATRKNLRVLVEEGKFREDLFYRLNVIPITISPLRDRPEDLTSLFSFFLQKYCKKNKRENLTVSADALGLIEDYKWPGNIRELENAVERAVILCRGHQITPEDLPPELSNSSGSSLLLNFGRGMTMNEIEKFVIESTLKRFNGDKNRTAETLGISMRTVYRKLDGYAK